MAPRPNQRAPKAPPGKGGATSVPKPAPKPNPAPARAATPPAPPPAAPKNEAPPPKPDEDGATTRVVGKTAFTRHRRITWSGVA